MRRKHTERSGTVSWHEDWCPIFEGSTCHCNDDDRRRRRPRPNLPLGGGEQPVREIENALR